MLNKGEFDLQPHLEGELLALRPLRVEDFEALYEAASDPLIWEGHPERDRYTRPVFQWFFDGAIASKGAFAIIERSTGRIIGSSRYFGLNESKSEIEIGWTFLTREFWGGKYNRELKSLMLTHAFKYVDRVLFFVGETNWRSQRAMQKIGGKLIRTDVRSLEDGGNHVVFAIDRSQ